jgi:hypothetical protein
VTLAERRKEIKQLTMETIKNKKGTLSNHFKTIYETMKTETLFEETATTAVRGWKVTELFDPRQGVTWGGEGCESVFVTNKTEASELEHELIRKTIGGRNVRPGHITWTEDYLVFPYLAHQRKWIPAFRNPSLGVDSLDFDVNLDESEKGQGPDYKLKIRMARKHVPFPKVAEYLFKHYEILSKRIFKERPLSDFKKMWYEYIWQRDPSISLKNKIVCPRLTPKARFAIDDYGYIPRDSVMSLLPRGQFKALKEALDKVVKKSVTEKDTLNYVLAFLNSKAFDDLIASQRAKKQGGYPMVGEKVLRRFVIPKPEPRHAEKVELILNGRFEQKDVDTFYK